MLVSFLHIYEYNKCVFILKAPFLFDLPSYIILLDAFVEVISASVTHTCMLLIEHCT